MALLYCPDCGHQVSDKAAACPNCGCPVAEMTNQAALRPYDPQTMEGKTPEDQTSIDIARDLYGDLLVDFRLRVWNDGGQIVGEARRKGDAL